MQNYGDIRKMNGADTMPVDIITGGSPCQDFSPSGKMEGLEGERSSLFKEMVRVVKEMRVATGNKPRFVVFENVLGAMSTNNGCDFLDILASFARVIEPDFPDLPSFPYNTTQPPPRSGYICGGCEDFPWSIAWRVCDASLWGLPQRRRRLMVLVDYDSDKADEILFGERVPLPGEQIGVDSSCVAYTERTLIGSPMWIDYPKSGKNTTEAPDYPIPCNHLDFIERSGVPHRYDITPRQAQVLFERIPFCNSLPERRYDSELITKLLCAITGDRRVLKYLSRRELEPFNIYRAFFVSSSRLTELLKLDTRCLTIRTTVARSNSDPTFAPMVVEFSPCASGLERVLGCDLEEGRFGVLVNGARENIDRLEREENCRIVGRLRFRNITPLECERLFGYPQGWTEGREDYTTFVPDSKRLEMLGNSIAIPQWLWLMDRLHTAIDEGRGVMKHHTDTVYMGSLFDGIGGFPYCARNAGIVPRWVCEIDPVAWGVSWNNTPAFCEKPLYPMKSSNT